MCWQCRIQYNLCAGNAESLAMQNPPAASSQAHAELRLMAAKRHELTRAVVRVMCTHQSGCRPTGMSRPELVCCSMLTDVSDMLCTSGSLPPAPCDAQKAGGLATRQARTVRRMQRFPVGLLDLGSTDPIRSADYCQYPPAVRRMPSEVSPLPLRSNQGGLICGFGGRDPWGVHPWDPCRSTSSAGAAPRGLSGTCRLLQTL